MIKEMNRPFALTNDEIKAKAALYLLENGVATMSEVAALQGWSRQRVYKLARDMDSRKKRKRFLDAMWQRTLAKMGSQPARIQG